MKKPINEIARLRRIAGLITEGEYQEAIMNEEQQYYIHDEEGMEEPIGPFSLDQAKQELAKQGAGYKLIDAETAKQIWSHLKEAKTSVSKDKKIQVIKEWIWFTCDEGQAKDDINKYNKMVDMYFASKDDVTKEDFKNIWNKVSEVWGVGDTGADSEGFPETWKDIQTGTLVNPGQTYEGKEKEEEAFGGINENSYLMAKNPDVKAKVDKIIELLIDIDVDGETMEYIHGAVGMDDQMANQYHNKAEYQSSNEGKEKEEEAFGGINEKTDPYDQFIKITKTGKELQPFHPKMKYGFSGYRGKENIKAKDMSSQKLTGAGYYRMSDDEFKKYQDLGLDGGSARVPFKLEGLNEGSADEVPLTPKVKKFIDKAIADAKKDGEFENLVDADWFDNELIDELIDLFEDEDYDSASKEVKDYISKVISVKESQMNEALKPHVYDRMYNLSSITGKMEMITAAEEIMNDLTEEGFEVPEIREFFAQLINEEIF